MSGLDIPGFEILERVGSGGMAVVWKARQISLDRTVAIKVLSSHLSAEADDIERFKTEAQAEAKLKHPGIVQVYDANVEAGSCYIVQEFIDGYSVGDWVRRKGHLSEEDTLLVAGYIADALAYAWETAGVIHCDIKPDNILIDADGSPKVTDLGLARTISAMTDDRISNEVMGTPAYMSPEQIQGLPDLDCRTDIYSLGAMLYHCATGKMLFQGEVDEALMEKHLSDQVPTAREMNEDLSPAICGLIEKMLVKNRDERYQDWESVQSDIARATASLPPAEPLDRPGLSTVKHMPMPMVVHSPDVTHLVPRKAKRNAHLVSALGTVLAGIAGILAGMWGYGRLMERVAPEKAKPAESMVHPAAQQRTERAQELLEKARKWRREHPDDFSGTVSRYRRVVKVGAGTDAADTASEELRGLETEHEKAMAEVIRSLDERVSGMIERDELLEAAQVFIDYDGKLAVDTAETRASRAAELRSGYEALEEQKRTAELEQRQWLESILDGVAGKLLSTGLPDGLRAVRTALANATDPDQAVLLSELEAILEDAADTDAEVVESFAAQVGEVIDVALKAGSRRLRIMGAVDGVIHARLVTFVDSVSVELQISPSDLSSGERLSRMGSDEEPDVALVKGLMAWRAGAMDYALRFFGKTHPTISNRLISAVSERAETNSERAAEGALVHLLRSVGLPFEDSYSREVAMIQLRSISVSSSDVDRIEMGVARYRQQYGETEFASENEAVLQAILAATGTAERKQSRYKTGIKITDELTVGAVVNALQKANPDLAAHEIIVNESDDGRITHVQIASGHLRDLSPLGACRDLAVLTLTCPGLRDLDGISSAPLASLVIMESDVQDISPLRRVPLTELRIESSPVRDLMPLRGKSLKTLSVADSRVGDLRGVMGMPLVALDISGTAIKRLDLLKGMPIDQLSLVDSRVSDLSVLRALPTTKLNASGTMIKDLGFVKGSKLETLNVARTAIGSLSGLRGSGVRSLNVSGTRVRSLDGLDGLELEHLSISDTDVFDLEPLRGLPLRSLSIDGTQVRRLDVLRSLPLVHLSCRNLKTSDYSALRGLRIESISIADLASVRDILKTMPNLTVVNGVEVTGEGARKEQKEGGLGMRRKPVRRPGPARRDLDF